MKKDAIERNAFLLIAELITTAPDEDAANRLASGAVQERVAACAQVDSPIHSFYRWEGNIEESFEFRISFKTSLGALERLTIWLERNHPYKVPQILIRESVASKNYHRWVESETMPSRPSIDESRV